MNTTSKYSVATGMGVVSPIGVGIDNFGNALKKGVSNFSYLKLEHEDRRFTYPVGEVSDFNPKTHIATLPLDEGIIQKARRIRNLSTSASWALYCALEAWQDSGLNKADINPERIAVLSGGSNTQQASIEATQERYRKKLPFLNPVYALNFFDTDLVGIISEIIGARGESYSVGAASASGNMVLIHAHRLIASGDYDAILVVAPLMELSIYQYQGFTALGAMALASEETPADQLCRPFDSDHCGFVYGQNAGCIILEAPVHAQKRKKQPYGVITGYGTSLDANRNPNPSAEGEKKAMASAISRAGIPVHAIDYVNTHGTASPTGDKTEVEALLAAGLKNVKANSTKSLIGHGLSAAGLVEAIACFAQMKHGFLHPNHNLNAPITDQIDWIDSQHEKATINYALSNSFGFGGINTSIVIKNTKDVKK